MTRTQKLLGFNRFKSINEVPSGEKKSVTMSRGCVSLLALGCSTTISRQIQEIYMRRSCSPPPAYPPPSPDHLYSELVHYYTFFRFIFWGYPGPHSVTCQKKRPLITVYYRSLGATVVPTENGPAFFRLFFKVLKAFQL